MNYELLENAILLRLNAKIGTNGTDCKLLPENDAEAKQELNRSITVVIDSADNVERMGDSSKSFQTLNSTTVQGGFVSISLLIKSRYLRGNEGVYKIKHDIDKYLVGYQIPGNYGSYQGPIFAGEFARIPSSDVQAGFHEYVYRLYIKELIVPVIEPETGPLATDIDGVTSEASDTNGLLVTNSEGSYSIAITENKVLPDISIIDFAGTVFAWPSVKNVNFAAGDLPAFDTGGSGPCEDATVTVNAEPFDTVTSGGTVDVPVVTTEDNPIGDVDNGKVVIPNTRVEVNGELLASVEAGSLVPGQVIDERNQHIGIYSTAHKWKIRDSRLFVNGTDVDELRPETDKELTITLNGAATNPTYTGGTINVTTPAPSGYVGLPLDVPAQIGTIVNTADVGAAFAAGAFSTPFPAGYAGYNSLDLTDPTGSTLAQNNVLFGTKNRFTNLTGTANTYTTVNWLDGAGVTRTARCMIDHLYGRKGICLLLTDDTGRWSVEWPTRLSGATYNGTNIYPVSRGMLDDLVRHDTVFQNHIDAYMSHSGLLYSGEVPSSGTTSVFSLNGNALGTVGRTTHLKVLLFHQIP